MPDAFLYKTLSSLGTIMASMRGTLRMSIHLSQDYFAGGKKILKKNDAMLEKFN